MKKKSKDFKFDFLLLIVFFTSIILIFATYAWFSSTLNVDLELVKIVVNTKDDFTFSLDGENWTNRLVISKNKILDDLNNIYPNNKNRWADEGLTTVSSPGLQNKNDYLTFYQAYSFRKIKDKYGKKTIGFNSNLYDENERSSDSDYIAFDLFFRNASHKLKDDDIFLLNTSKFNNASGNENIANNAIRLGMVISDPTSIFSDRNIVQALKCQNNCKTTIFEPNSTIHTEKSIKQAKKNGIIIEDGKQYPTYALKRQDSKINLNEGLYGTSYNINENYFIEQKTIKSYNEPVFQIGNEIKKIRVYIWIEGQDIDVFAIKSEGYKININLDFKNYS